MENLLQYSENDLLEDIAFPLKVNVGYLFDYADNMIADQIDDSVIDSLIGEYIEIENVTEKFILSGDEIIDNRTGLSVARIRGWGRLQYKDRARSRQKNIANYLVDRLNAE